MWRKALQKIIWLYLRSQKKKKIILRNSSPLYYCQGSIANNGRGSWVKLWAIHECTHAVTENNEAKVLLDYYRSRLCSTCSQVPLMPSPWRSDAHTTYAITYHDFTLAILYIRIRYYWKDSPNNIQWPWIHTYCYWLFH